jgi:hypothetical protein
VRKTAEQVGIVCLTIAGLVMFAVVAGLAVHTLLPLVLSPPTTPGKVMLFGSLALAAIGSLLVYLSRRES